MADIVIEETVILLRKPVKRIHVADELPLVNYTVATGSAGCLVLNCGDREVEVE